MGFSSSDSFSPPIRLYLEPSEKHEKHIKTWFRKTDGWWDAVEIVSCWHVCACVPSLTFLRKDVGIYQTWFLEPIINIKSPAITHAFSICCILHHPPTPSDLGSSRHFLIFARPLRDRLAVTSHGELGALGALGAWQSSHWLW